MSFNEAYKGFIQRFLNENISVNDDYKDLKLKNSKTKSIDKIVVGKEDSNFLCQYVAKEIMIGFLRNKNKLPKSSSKGGRTVSKWSGSKAFKSNFSNDNKYLNTIEPMFDEDSLRNITSFKNECGEILSENKIIRAKEFFYNHCKKFGQENL